MWPHYTAHVCMTLCDSLIMPPTPRYVQSQRTWQKELCKCDLGCSDGRLSGGAWSHHRGPSMRDGGASVRGGSVTMETEDGGLVRAGKGKEKDPFLQPPEGTNSASSFILTHWLLPSRTVSKRTNWGSFKLLSCSNLFQQQWETTTLSKSILSAKLHSLLPLFPESPSSV